MNSAEIVSKVRKIELSTKKLVDGLLVGNYHSVFKGNGIEFSDLHEYTPFDDSRCIDWNVTARFDAPYVKEFIEERDLLVYVVFDVSGSFNFGNLSSKRDRALEIVCSILFAAMRNNDKVGVFLCSNHVEKYFPARKGRRHVFRMMSGMLGFEVSSRRTNLGACLEEVHRILKKRSILFIVSDFLGQDISKPLRLLRHKHDVVGINVFDDRETNIPDVGFIELEDEETGEQILVDTSDEEFRKRYSNLMENERAKSRDSFRKLKLDSIAIGSSISYALALRQFFKIRKRRLVR